MKRGLNFRLIFLLLLLAGLAIREVAVELRPSFLRPGLHMLAYVGNTGDGTVTAIDLIALSRAATIATGPSPSGLRAHPTRPEIWGVSTNGGYAWVIDARGGRVAAKIPVGELPYAIDFSPDREAGVRGGLRCECSGGHRHSDAASDRARTCRTTAVDCSGYAGWEAGGGFKPRRCDGITA